MRILDFYYKRSVWEKVGLVIGLSIVMSVSFGTLRPHKASATTFYTGPYSASQQNLINSCNNNVHAGFIWGIAYFIPSTLNQPGASAPLTLETFVCNNSGGSVNNDTDYYGPARTIINGVSVSNVITYPASPPLVGGYYTINNGSFANKQSKFIDFTVTLNTSVFPQSGSYSVKIKGYGCITWTSGGTPSCTNVVEGGFGINIIVSPPSAATAAGGPTCSGWTGWAYDPDHTSSLLKVQLYGSGGTPIGAQVTAQNAAPPIDSNQGSMSGVTGHGFDLSSLVSQYEDYTTHYFYIVVYGVDSTGVQDTHNYKSPTYAIGPCVTPSCVVNTTISTDLGTPFVLDPGDSFKATLTLNYNTPSGPGADSAPGTLGATITSLAGPTQSLVRINVTKNPGNTVTYIAGNPSPVLTWGTLNHTTTSLNTTLSNAYTTSALFTDSYIVKGGLTGPSYNLNGATVPLQVTCTKTINFTAPVFKPYLGVFGGDVYAGGDFSGGDCYNYTSDIKTYVSTDSSGSAGSGSQFAALASGNIDFSSPGSGFASALLSSIANPPIDLSFSNTVTPPGQFDGDCNYVTGFDLPTTWPATNTGGSTNTANWPSVPNNIYYSNTPTTLIGANIIPPGRHITLYANGNVELSSSIKYQSPSSWKSPSDIPSLTIIAAGDIQINNNAANLEGTFVAHGRIFTCYDTVGNKPWLVTELYTSCNKQLTVHGKLIATDIKWTRAIGDIAAANDGENPYPGGTSGAAEVVIDGPETYITPNNGSTGSPTYDYIATLPPIL